MRSAVAWIFVLALPIVFFGGIALAARRAPPQGGRITASGGREAGLTRTRRQLNMNL